MKDDLRVKGIIFDLDGVITRTDHLHFLSWNRISTKYNLIFNEEINKSLLGLSRPDSINKILEFNNKTMPQELKDKICEEKNEIYKEYLNELSEKNIIDGVIPLLDYLDSKSIKYSIGSSSKNTMFILERLGLKNRFKYIVDGTMVKEAKPNPEIFLKAASLMNIEPKDILVIEDGEAGIIAANNGGFNSVEFGLNEYKVTPKYKVTNILDIKSIIEGKNKPQIVFSDIDGTLITPDHKVTPRTKEAILKLKDNNIPFVLVSARSPSGIYTIMKQIGIKCPIIAYSGGLVLDENGKELYSNGFSKSLAKEVIDYIEDHNLDLSYNAFSNDTWVVKTRDDERIIWQEGVVEFESTPGGIDILKDTDPIHKFLLICNPHKTLEIEKELQDAFPNLTIVKSGKRLIEVMEKGVSKEIGVKTYAQFLNIDIKDCMAFGDNYNDLEMLLSVGTPIIMGNAPDDLKSKFSIIAKDNKSDGIYYALKDLKII